MSRNANSLRGEVNFKIGDQDLLLRPSFENLVAAEDELGSLFALVERASGGELTVREITTLLWHCLPHDSRPNREIVGSAVMGMGLVKAIIPVRTILAQALRGEG